METPAIKDTDETWCCGPLAVSLLAENRALRAKVCETLSLYGVPWEEPRLPVRLEVRETAEKAPMVEGTFLECSRMQVETGGSGLHATCLSGASVRQGGAGTDWVLSIPSGWRRPEDLEDIEDLVNLVLTTGWRELGWVPLHAGAVVMGAACALVCAPSQGGKSTLVAALMHRGWKTVSDDKLLLRQRGNGPEIASLSYKMNLHPNTRRWFAEVGDLEKRPVYSRWTEKRKVDIADIWPGRQIARARPTHVVLVRRHDILRGIAVHPLGNSEVMSILLHQTVIPNDQQAARSILRTVTAAAGLRGFRVQVGFDAYRDPECLAPLEDALG